QGGATLVKHQWDCLFSSGVVIGMFEKEEDGASMNGQDLRDLLEKLRKSYLDNVSVELPAEYVINTNQSFDFLFKNHAYKSIAVTNMARAKTVNVKASIETSVTITQTNYYEIVIGSVKVILKNKIDSDYMYSYLTNSSRNIVLFVNGYRFATSTTENSDTDDKITETDRYNYWDGVDQTFINRLVPEHVFYADGHMGIRTSNHFDMGKFYCSARLTIGTWPSNYKEAILKYADNAISYSIGGSWVTNTVLATCNVVVGSSTLNIAPNVSGFNERLAKGNIGGVDFVKKLKQSSFVATDTLDIVCHSMGFAYALGMVDAVKAAFPNIKLGNFYIIAPENAGSGMVNMSDWMDVWQYGTDDEVLKNKPWLQDGVAPQVSVKGLPQTKRAFIPTDGSVPQGFLSSHSIGNYKWIFTKQTIGRPGYVKPRK
ncbi:hypothetical protein, partial [Williamwhitmania taraxaci]